MKYDSFHCSHLSEGYRDEMRVCDLVFGQPKFIDMLSSKLDKESRTIGNWKSLATQFGIRKQKTEQFGLSGSGPTAALFQYISTADGLKDLTIGDLCEHFTAMERKDLVNVLQKHHCKGLYCVWLSSAQSDFKDVFSFSHTECHLSTTQQCNSILITTITKILQ